MPSSSAHFSVSKSHMQDLELNYNYIKQSPAYVHLKNKYSKLKKEHRLLTKLYFKTAYHSIQTFDEELLRKKHRSHKNKKNIRSGVVYVSEDDEWDDRSYVPIKSERQNEVLVYPEMAAEVEYIPPREEHVVNDMTEECELANEFERAVSMNDIPHDNTVDDTVAPQDQEVVEEEVVELVEEEEEVVVEEEEEVVELVEEEEEVVELVEEEEEVVELVEEEEEVVELVEEEEGETVYEVVINGTTYFTTNEQNGPIYESTEDGDVGDQVGEYENGKPTFFQ